MSGPGVTPNSKAKGLAYSFDLFATLADLAGLPAPNGIDSRNLLAADGSGQASGRGSILALYRDSQRMVADQRWKLIRYQVQGQERIQLFDLARDPDETNDLSAAPDKQSRRPAPGSKHGRRPGDRWMPSSPPAQTVPAQNAGFPMKSRLLLLGACSAALLAHISRGLDYASEPHAKDGNALFFQMHESFLARGKSGPIGLLFLGDSITARWTEAPEVWKAHFGRYEPADFGIGGDSTHHVIWRIEHGELDGIHPAVVVLLLGTNNTIHFSGQEIAAADAKIVRLIREKIPGVKVLVLAIFPQGGAQEPERHPRRRRPCDGGHSRGKTRNWPSLMTAITSAFSTSGQNS